MSEGSWMKVLAFGKLTPGGVECSVKVVVREAVYEYVGSFYVVEQFVKRAKYAPGKALAWLKKSCDRWELIR